MRADRVSSSAEPPLINRQAAVKKLENLTLDQIATSLKFFHSRAQQDNAALDALLNQSGITNQHLQQIRALY